MSKKVRAYRVSTKYTTRTKISQSQIEKLRVTRLGNAKSFAELKFYKSASFDKLLRKQARMNTQAKSMKLYNQIKNRISADSSQQRGLNMVFGTKNYYKNGRVVHTGGFHTQSKLKKLQTAVKQLENGKFNILNRVKHMQEYKDVKGYLSGNAGMRDILVGITRNTFYYQEREKIIQFNEVKRKIGFARAKHTKIGIELDEAHTIWSQDAKNNPLFGFVNEMSGKLRKG